jgi:hypothetical protein
LLSCFACSSGCTERIPSFLATISIGSFAGKKYNIMHFTEQDKNRILEAANGRLLDVVVANTSAARRGSTYVGRSPSCEE